LDNLSQLYLVRKDFKRAAPLLKQLLVTANDVLPADSPRLPYHALDLAGALLCSQDDWGAWYYHKYALQRAEAIFGPEDPRLVPFLDGYAATMARLGVRRRSDALTARARKLEQGTAAKDGQAAPTSARASTPDARSPSDVVAERPKEDAEVAGEIFHRSSASIVESLSDVITVELWCRTAPHARAPGAVELTVGYRFHNLSDQEIVFDAHKSFSRYSVWYYSVKGTQLESNAGDAPDDGLVLGEGYEVRPWYLVKTGYWPPPRFEKVVLPPNETCQREMRMVNQHAAPPGLQRLSLTLHFVAADGRAFEVPVHRYLIHSSDDLRERPPEVDDQHKPRFYLHESNAGKVWPLKADAPAGV
jgi:hypothetical protein